MAKTIYYDGADIDKIVAVYDPIGNYDAHWVTGQGMTKINTATGSFTAGVDHRHHKIVADVITEMSAGEKTSHPLPVVDKVAAETWKTRVRLATAAALPANTRVGNGFTADANGALPTIDGVAPALQDRILDKDNATGADRGVKIVTDLGGAGSKWVMQRADDSDASAEVESCETTIVAEGTVNGGYSFWLSTADPIVLNTTALTYTKGPKKNDSGSTVDDIWSANKTQAVVDAAVVGLYDHKGAYDAGANSPDLDTSPSGVKKGDAYTVSVTGTFFTEVLEVGDVIIADQDDPTLLTHWTRVQKSIDAATTTTKGIVELATDGEGAADKAVQGNDARMSDSRAPSGTAGGSLGGTYPNPTVDAVKLDDAAAPDDNTDLNVSTTKHGLVPKAPNDATKFLDGTGVFSVPAGGSSPSVAKKSADQSFSADALANVTDLSFAVTLNKIYKFEAWVLIETSSSAEGPCIGFTFPAMTYLYFNIHLVDKPGINVSTSGGEQAGIDGTDSGVKISNAAVNFADLPYVYKVEGMFSPSASGTLQLQAARENSGSSTVKVLKGARMELEDVT